MKERLKLAHKRLLPEKKVIIVHYRSRHASSLRGPHQTRYLQNIGRNPHRYLRFDSLANNFNLVGPEKLASDGQLHSDAIGFIHQYCLTLPCFL